MGVNTMHESELWTRARARDGRAFAALFDLHRDRVFRHCVRLVDTIADAEEVTASAFFELWRKQARVTTVDGSVLPWLLVTAGNLARNSARGTRRYRATLDALPHPADVQPGDIQPIDDTAVRDALARLRPVDASLVTLVVLEGYSVVDAAATLRLNAGAARTRLHRAKAALRATPEFANLGWSTS
jgi:RNA polymerase sigma-70 factor (ECF subfamily)